MLSLQVCPAGRLCETTGLSAMQDCPVGYKCSGGAKTQCGQGRYAPLNSDTCFSCPEGL